MSEKLRHNMHTHTSTSYICPICPAVHGLETEHTWIKQADIIFRDEYVMVFIGSKFIQGHEGYPLVVPVQHFENIYDIPESIIGSIAAMTKKMATAVKDTFECDGITIVQNNEPAGDQHAFHYHVHIVPRFHDDVFHNVFMKGEKSSPEERIPYAERLRAYLLSHLE